MSVDVSCTMCGRQVDDADTVPMPNGLICAHPCYEWLEEMMEQIKEDPDVEIEFFDLEEDDEDYDDDEDF